MANKAKFQAIKGTRDLLPPETQLWNRVEQTAHEVFATFGFGEIRLPVFETADLFARSVGADSDIVRKEMYVFAENPDADDPEDVTQLLDRYQDLSRSYERKVTNEDAGAYVTSARVFANEVQRRLDARTITSNPVLEKSLKALKNALFEYYEPADFRPDLKPELRKAILLSEIRIQVEAFSFGEQMSLRPEATASVCRAYIEHSMQQQPQPVKLYYTGPMFRRERPQKGRYRQFYQIGAEILGGSDAPAIDAELIEMLMTFFAKLDLEGTTLHINSIGHSAPNCRRGYVEKLKAELEKVKDNLSPDSQRRIETNPLRVLDSKVESEQAIIATLPHIADHLCEDCAKHYAAVKQHLELRGVIYRENWRLVRGLDYYMRTTFEVTAQGLGSQNAVCGGGRYDGLVELLGGPPTKGIGFAIGEDRLILSLQEGGKAQTKQGRDVYIAWMGERAYATAVRAAKDLRNAGFSVELPPTELKFGKALGQADKLGARYALILGDNEVSEGLWTLKTLADGTQTKLPEPAIIEHLRKSLSPVVAGL